jgi:hypothetical protein
MKQYPITMTFDALGETLRIRKGNYTLQVEGFAVDTTGNLYVLTPGERTLKQIAKVFLESLVD